MLCNPAKGLQRPRIFIGEDYPTPEEENEMAEGDIWLVIGEIDHALQFAGDGNVDIGDALNFEYNQPFTIEAIINTQTTEACAFVCSQEEGNGVGIMFGLGAYTSNNPIFLRLRHDGTTNQIEVRSNSVSLGQLPPPYNDGNYHRITATYNGSGLGSGVKLYFDGEECPNTYASHDNLNDTIVSTENTYIGSRAGVEQFFTGIIDDVRIWDHVRTQQQIEEWKFKRLKGDEPGLVGYWPLDDGSGGIAVDKTGNNDGVITNGIWIKKH